MSFNTFITGTQKVYEKSDIQIKIGTKVQYKTDDGIILNLIAVKHEQSEPFDMWSCVDPCGHSKNGECTMYNCFTDELKLGWDSRVRSERKVIEELVYKMKKEYLLLHDYY